MHIICNVPQLFTFLNVLYIDSVKLKMYMYERVCICACVAGTCLTAAIFTTLSTKEI